MTEKFRLTLAHRHRGAFNTPLRVAADIPPERNDRSSQYAQYNFVAFAPSNRSINSSGDCGHE